MMTLGDRVVVASVDHHLFRRFRLRLRFNLPDDFVPEESEQNMHRGFETANRLAGSFQQECEVRQRADLHVGQLVRLAL